MTITDQLADTRRELAAANLRAETAEALLDQRIGDLEQRVTDLEIGLAGKGLLNWNESDIDRAQTLRMLETHWRTGGAR